MITEIGLAGAGVAAASKIKEDSLIGLIYKDLAQPSVQAIGKALGHTFDFATIPFQVMKFGTDVAKLNLKKRLDSYEEKLNKIPEDQRIEVNPQVGVPILERLTYTTNDDIAELFTNLLLKASSIESVNQAHPAFIQIIDRLTVDEARILTSLLNKDNIPFVTFKLEFVSGGTTPIEKYASLIPFEVELIGSGNVLSYYDNLIGLGILSIPSGLFKANEELYRPIYERYPFDEANLNQTYSAPETIKGMQKEKGYFQITEFGKLFIKTCVSMDT
jgi:hypothetical protein